VSHWRTSRARLAAGPLWFELPGAYANLLFHNFLDTTVHSPQSTVSIAYGLSTVDC